MKKSKDEAAADLEWGQRLAEEIARELAGDPELRDAFAAITEEDWLREVEKSEALAMAEKFASKPAATKRRRRAPNSRS